MSIEPLEDKHFGKSDDIFLIVNIDFIPFQVFLILLVLAFTSVDIIFLKFLDLHSRLPEKKKIFVTNFSFLTDSLNPPPPPHYGKNPLSVTEVFVDAP